MSLRGDWLLFKTKRSRLKQQVATSFMHPNRRQDEVAPEQFPDPDRVTVVPLEQGRLVTVTPKQETTKHVVLLHGGAYTVPATESHREWLIYISDQLGARATLIDYPLAPEATATVTVPATVAAYQELGLEYPDDQFYLLGDSAGGGLALVLLQQLRDQHALLPKASVLVSPWTDLAMRDPQIKARDDEDPELSFAAMRQTAVNYAGQLVLDDALLSPINGNLEHLGRIGLFYGTTELLLPDHQRLATKLQQATGTQVDVHELKGMLHDYLFWHALPESRQTFKYLAEQLNQA